MTANSNKFALDFYSNSNNNTIQNTTINSNYGSGIYFSLGSSNTIQNTTVNSNKDYGIYLSSGSNNIFISNTLSKNVNIIYITDYTNNFSSNQFLDNIGSLSTFLTPSQEANISSRIDFNFTMKYINGSNCPSCSYKLDLYPSETNLENSSSGGLIIGNFTPTKVGIYSLRINITDENNNSEIRKYIYLVNAISGLVNYYFRSQEPIHGQPANLPGEDTGSLLLDKPTLPENRNCGTWIQFSPDELPNYLFGIYKNINYSIWYETVATAINNTGIQRYATYNSNVDYNTTISATSKSVETFNFTVNWINDYSWTWYWVGIKLTGSVPYIYSNQTDPSYANITYTYSTTPAIKEITNEDIQLLSATMTSNTSTIANITLEGEGTTNFSILMPDTTKTYGITYDDVDCNNNENCTLNFQSNGEINLTLILGSEHELYIFEDTTAPIITFSCSPTSVTAGATITCSCSATDDVDSSPTISYTVNPSTSSTGTFTTTCTATDDAGNSASSSISYTVSSLGGGTLPFWGKTFVFDNKEFNEIGSITKELSKKSRIRIKINNEKHYIGIVDLINETATINISSKTQQITFAIGEEKKFEVTDDNYYDLSVKLNSIENNKANLTIKSIYEEIPCEPDWKCTEWGECQQGKQTRTCTDLSSCNTTEGKPDEVKSCCEPDWECTEWSECIDGKQTRICIDLNDCNVTEGRLDEVRECEPETDYITIVIVSALIVAVVIVGFLIRKQIR